MKMHSNNGNYEADIKTNRQKQILCLDRADIVLTLINQGAVD
jgi:hypothetical protein